MNINIRGELYDLSSSKVMGILNLTPDSFYDGGKYNNVDDVSCLLYTSPSPRDRLLSRMPSSA